MRLNKKKEKVKLKFEFKKWLLLLGLAETVDLLLGSWLAVKLFVQLSSLKTKTLTAIVLDHFVADVVVVVVMNCYYCCSYCYC
jgi:hypothetical protein